MSGVEGFGAFKGFVTDSNILKKEGSKGNEAKGVNNADLSPIDLKLKDIVIEKFKNENGENVLLITEFSTMNEAKALELQNKEFEVGRLGKVNGKRVIRLKDTGKEIENVDLIEVRYVGKKGDYKVKNLALEHFQFERMDAEEYDKLKSVVQGRLQAIVDQAKRAEEKKEESLIDRATHLGGIKNLNGSHKAKAMGRTIPMIAPNQNESKAEVAKKTLDFYIEKANRQKRKREEHEEAAEVIRKAVENDEKKRDIRIEEVGKQEEVSSIFKAEDVPKPPKQPKRRKTANLE